uniref:Chromosome 10 open reading frame 88 n=2 Tax=Nothobranchius korthausae TaxID=1143690 RepID=A0A1A8GG53_9TELE
MVDISVKRAAAWVCQTHDLAEILLPVHLSTKDSEDEDLSLTEKEETDRVVSAQLEQVEEGSPCILTLSCRSSSDTISRLMVVSEARTMEVYNQMEEYCGTVRGIEDKTIQLGEDRGPVYKKQLIFEHPSSACEVKLLSLAGRSSVVVCRVVVGLQELQPGPAHGPGIDLQQVQCLVEEMGTSLSPGAQNLLDMVQFQQKNQMSSLSGFLPLLMGGGALSALAGGTGASTSALRNSPQPSDFLSPDCIRPADLPAAQNGGMSEGSTSPDLSLSDLSTNNTSSSESGVQMSHTLLEEMMSQFMKGRGQQQVLSPDLLPMLQSVCGQVTQLRLDDAEMAAEKKMRNGGWELNSAMERHLEEMERRLKEHMDRRLDALEQKLEKALLSALPMVSFNTEAVSRSAGGSAPVGPSEHISLTPSPH